VSATLTWGACKATCTDKSALGQVVNSIAIKRWWVILFPLRCDGSPLQGYSIPPIYTPGWREGVRIPCLAQEHSAMRRQPVLRDLESSALDIRQLHLHSFHFRGTYVFSGSWQGAKRSCQPLWLLLLVPRYHKCICSSCAFNVYVPGRCVSLMISAVDSAASSSGSSPGQEHCVVSLARRFTLTLPLSTQVDKWVPVKLMLGVTLRWTSISSRGD